MPTKRKITARRSSVASRTAPRRPSSPRAVASFDLSDDSNGRQIRREMNTGGRFYGAGATIQRMGHGNLKAVVSVSSISDDGKVDTYKEIGYGRTQADAISEAVFTLWQRILPSTVR